MPGRFNIPPPPQEKGPSEWWPALLTLGAALALAALLLALTWAGCSAMAGVPGVTGVPVASATSVLRDAGYEPVEKAAPSDTVPKGHVVETVVPEGGTGSDVVVVVSSGPAEDATAERAPARADATSKAPTGSGGEPTVPSGEAAAADGAVASDIRDQRERVAAIEGALVAPGAASDPGAAAEARAALEDIAGQSPQSAASPCATAAQRRWLASLNRALEGDLTPEAARALTAAADKAAAEISACSPRSPSGSMPGGTAPSGAAPSDTDTAQATPLSVAGDLCAPQAADAARKAVVDFGNRHGERAVFPFSVPCAVADVRPTVEVQENRVTTMWRRGGCTEACGDVIFIVAVGMTARTCSDPSQSNKPVRLGNKRMWNCRFGEESLDSYNVDGSGDLTYSVLATPGAEVEALPAMLASLDLSAADWGMALPPARPAKVAPKVTYPPGSAPRVAFAFTTGWGEGGASVADSNGKVLRRTPAPVGDLVYDKSGVLWLSSGGWDNSGEPTSACDVRRFGDSSALFVGDDVLARLIRSGRVAADTPGNNLLCGPLSPSPQGGVQDIWEDLVIRMLRRGGAVRVTRAPAGSSTADGFATWNGEIVAYSRDADGAVTSSRVPGVGTVPGEVTFLSPRGQMLVADRGDMEEPDEISLVEADGSSRVIWPSSLGKKIAVHRAQGQTTAISRDGKWVFVLSGGYACMSCTGDVYRVDLARGGPPKRVARDVVTLGVPPLPAKPGRG